MNMRGMTKFNEGMRFSPMNERNKGTKYSKTKSTKVQ